MKNKTPTVILFVFSLFILSIVIRGYVLAVMWEWFVLPVTYFAELNIPQAIGLSVLVAMMTKDLNVKKEKIPPAERWGQMVLGPFVLLGIGWILHKLV